MRVLFFLSLVFGGLADPNCTRSGNNSDLPDPQCTPGVPFTGSTGCGGKPCTKETLCVPGYSKTVRSVSSSEKAAVFASYGVKNHQGYCHVDNGQGCEIDHLISLEIGGSNEQGNLWPQPYDTPEGETTWKWNAHVKDTLENKLHKSFCADEMTLEAVQSCISKDWIACYKEHMKTDEPIESCGGRCDDDDDDDDDETVVVDETAVAPNETGFLII